MFFFWRHHQGSQHFICCNHASVRRTGASAAAGPRGPMAASSDHSFFLFFPFSLFPLVSPFWVFSALLVLADLFSPFGFHRALYVAWVCFAWFYFLLELFFFSINPQGHPRAPPCVGPPALPRIGGLHGQGYPAQHYVGECSHPGKRSCSSVPSPT